MIELANVIKDLREELQKAIDAGREEELRFELGPIELEVSVVVDRSDGGHGKVRFWVVDMGGEHKKDTTDNQRIKLSLTPQLAGGTRRPQVSGQAEPDES
ncbi:MAG: hypothetical protein HOV87_02515 [Catenulispora sp.]|nr:hypothetical protein [Catenulispora sp.]